MEPKKLISSFGVIITTVTAVILFLADYDKIKSFFFPAQNVISTPLFITALVATNILTFYILYNLYFKERELSRKYMIEVKNLKSLVADSEKLRLIDFTTGIPNEHKFKIDLQNRPKELFHLIIIDLDGFGQINNKLGFQKGDEVIRFIAQELVIKMRRDEEIYKRAFRLNDSFMKRVYRKYSGGDEFIFLIKGGQFEAVGFITRVQKQLNKLSEEAKILSCSFRIDFHAAIVTLYPSDTYEQAYDKLQRAYIQAAEEHEGLRVFWDRDMEKQYLPTYSSIYESARKVFKVRSHE